MISAVAVVIVVAVVVYYCHLDSRGYGSPDCCIYYYLCYCGWDWKKDCCCCCEEDAVVDDDVFDTVE